MQNLMMPLRLQAVRGARRPEHARSDALLPAAPDADPEELHVLPARGVRVLRGAHVQPLPVLLLQTGTEFSFVMECLSQVI